MIAVDDVFVLRLRSAGKIVGLLGPNGGPATTTNPFSIFAGVGDRPERRRRGCEVLVDGGGLERATRGGGDPKKETGGSALVPQDSRRCVRTKLSGAARETRRFGRTLQACLGAALDQGRIRENAARALVGRSKRSRCERFFACPHYRRRHDREAAAELRAAGGPGCTDPDNSAAPTKTDGFGRRSRKAANANLRNHRDPERALAKGVVVNYGTPLHGGKFRRRLAIAIVVWTMEKSLREDTFEGPAKFAASQARRRKKSAARNRIGVPPRSDGKEACGELMPLITLVAMSAKGPAESSSADRTIPSMSQLSSMADRPSRRSSDFESSRGRATAGSPARTAISRWFA